MREKLLRNIYKLVHRYTWWLLGLSLLISILSVLAIRELEMRSSFLDLFPKEDPLRIIYQLREETIQKADQVAIRLALKAPPASALAGIEQLKAAAEALIGKLKKSEEIIFADYRPGLEIPQLNPFFASTEQLQALAELSEKIRQSLSGLKLEGKEKLADSYQALNSALERAIRTQESTEVDIDKLTQQLAQLSALNKEVRSTLEKLPKQVGEAEAGVEGLLKHVQTLEERLQPKELLSKDQRALLVLARPKAGAQRGLAYNQKITQIVKGAIQQAGLPEMGVEAELAGPYVISTESNQMIQRDMWKTTIISALGILLVFILAFGHPFYPILAAIPLLVALLMTLAWAKLSVGGLNLVTSFLPSLVLGLGIDYGIHFLAHYTEERRKGLPMGPALENTIIHKGHAMLTAALTTSFVLFGLMLARLPGLFEMGVIAGMGILFSVLATLMLLPALIIAAHVAFGQRFWQAHKRYQPDLTRAVHKMLAHRKPILALGVLATLLMLWPALRVEFQFVSEEMVPKHLKSLAVLSKIRQEFELGATEIGEFFIFFTKSPQGLQRLVSELNKIELIAQISSLEGFLPSALEAKERILQKLDLEGELVRSRTVLDHFEANLVEKERFLEQIRKLIGNLSHMQTLAAAAGRGDLAVELNNLIQALLELETRVAKLDAPQLTFEVTTLKERLNTLEGRLKPIFQRPKPQIADLPQSFKERFLTGENEFVIYAHLKSAQLYRKEYYKQVIERITRIAKESEAEYFGTPLIQARLEEYMLRDFWVATLFAALVILLLLWLDFRQTPISARLRFSPLLAMLPLSLGYVWMLGGMKLFNMHLNFANILISPLLVGMGIDFSVYILHRYAKDRDIAPAVGATAVSILITAATTMVAFASLLLAETPGLRMLGQSALLGIGLTALFSVSFLPAVIGVAPTGQKR